MDQLTIATHEKLDETTQKLILDSMAKILRTCTFEEIKKNKPLAETIDFCLELDDVPEDEINCHVDPDKLWGMMYSRWM